MGYGCDKQNHIPLERDNLLSLQYFIGFLRIFMSLGNIGIKAAAFIIGINHTLITYR